MDIPEKVKLIDLEVASLVLLMIGFGLSSSKAWWFLSSSLTGGSFDGDLTASFWGSLELSGCHEKKIWLKYINRLCVCVYKRKGEREHHCKNSRCGH